MSSWKECKLGEVAFFQRGHDLPKTQMNDGLIPVAGSNGIIGFHDKSTTKAPGITIGRSGNIGIPKFYNQEFWAHNTVLYVKDFKGNDEKFVFYLLNTIDLSGFNSGSAVPTLNRNHIHEIDMRVPPLEEQKAIAEVLSSLDDKIDLLHRQNQTLESLAQTLFRQWFGSETLVSPLDEAKASFPNRENWKEKPLGKITNIAIGRTPPRKEDEWFSTDFKDVKWISIKDLGNDGVFIFKTSEYLTQEAVERFNVPVIPKDTVVLSFKMTVGRVAITTETMLSNEAIAHFKFHDKTPISKEYLYLFLKTFPYDSLGSTSSIVTAINSAMIKEMMILIPDEKTIKDFSSIVEPQFEKIRQNQQQIQTLENLRDTLLPKLLSGEVRVKI